MAGVEQEEPSTNPKWGLQLCGRMAQIRPLSTPAVGVHRPLPTASSTGSESPRRTQHIRHWLEQHFTQRKKKCSKISVCMIYRLRYGQRVPCESQLRVVGCRQFSDTEGEDLVPFPLVANIMVRLVRCHMMQRLKQYKGSHWVPSIRERFLLTREKTLGLRDSLPPASTQENIPGSGSWLDDSKAANHMVERGRGE